MDALNERAEMNGPIYGLRDVGPCHTEPLAAYVVMANIIMAYMAMAYKVMSTCVWTCVQTCADMCVDMCGPLGGDSEARTVLLQRSALALMVQLRIILDLSRHV